MKKIIFALGLLLTTLTASAQYTKSLCLTTDDGTDVFISLSRQLSISFDNDAQTLTANDGQQQITASLSKVKLYYSSEAAPTKIDQPQAEPQFTDNQIVFRGLKQGQPVRVFSADGKLLLTLGSAADDQPVRLDLSALPKGLCIIQAGTCKLKYLKR